MVTRTWSFFCHFKVFRLPAILHGAVGAVRAHSGKGTGYCYMTARGPNSCLLGQVTWLLFCLYINFFPSSSFNSVEFWSSMSRIVLDTEVGDKNVLKELGNSFDGKVQGYSFLSPKKYKPTKQSKQFGVQETCTELCGTMVVWITVRLPTLSLEMLMVNTLQKEQKNRSFSAVSWIKCKTRMIMAAPKFEILLLKKGAFARDTQSDTKSHFTVQSARNNCLVTGQSSI